MTNTLAARGVYSQKNWVGVCGPLPKTLTLFMTKICDLPYPIYDLTLRLLPFFRTAVVIISPVQTNVKDNVYLSLLGIYLFIYLFIT